HREPPARSRGLDAIGGGIFGEAQRLRAIGVERPVAMREVEGGARVERGQVRDQLDRGLAFPAGEGAESGEEVVVGKGGGGREDVGLHGRGVSRAFSRSGGAAETILERRSRTAAAAHGAFGGAR